ncbi:MAG: GGDEF domain-containing protein [Butyrivibrio sp.]|uniref:GGDEF domain-containing protein n=1 Tax=Butyrivibrio sp. TaxID=28121 RepID=UPI0025EDB363|nr:GGDEF domain-containing protein [Butyrivibrio sp.]MCR5770910.1 GGDEF domain-containing protein [Butyrivibrio sp.]
MTIFEDLGLWSYLIDFIASILILIIGIWTIKTGNKLIGHIALPIVLNCIIMPASYWACGGLNTGTILYFVVSLFTIGVLLTGKAMYIVYLICFLVQSISIWIPLFYPQIIIDNTMPSETAYIMDFNIALLLTSLALLGITSMIYRAYYKERDKNEKLIERLKSLSEKDELSGLYNRRELFIVLEYLYSEKEDKYVHLQNGIMAMFDIDNFKILNDTYGHLFGDEVLKKIASVIQGHLDSAKYEMAFRYGGEEFVCIMNSEKKEDALARIDDIRNKIEKIKWEDHPDLTVTVSGGAVHCADYDNFTDALKEVDALLYQAKNKGKNHIIM